ncbi:acyltransferase family protein [Paenibacillus tarimensis]|uniref:acyltransferase family protein n=1 Tax=Paenibacillus tarimensis TaxID=416012 RepID=UPI001F195F7A|nr:acyltransferase family protein [Paenibacillus tarimensis]MCF2943452.1 acyltransferase family protein [Paenibacillus tarimensis]
MPIKEIFVIRCISCLSVVLLHVLSLVLMLHAEQLAGVSHTIDSLRTLLMFSTPAFIFISEFLLARSYPDGVPKGFLAKRGQVIFIPFLFIAALDALMMTSAAESGLTVSAYMEKLAQNVLLGNFIGYFILVIFQFYILHILLHSFLRQASPKGVLTVSFLVTAAYLSYFTWVVPPKSDTVFPFFWVPFPGWLFYFCLAYYCGREYETFLQMLERYRRVLYGSVTVLAVVVVAVSYYGNIGMISSKRPDILLYSTCMICLFFHVFSTLRNVPKIIMTISNYSFSIYLLHFYFMSIGYVVLTSTPAIPALAAFLLVFAASVVGPVLLSWALNKLRYGYLFVGKIYQPKRLERTADKRETAG